MANPVERRSRTGDDHSMVSRTAATALSPLRVLDRHGRVAQDALAAEFAAAYTAAEATRSAVVTHARPEAAAGAVAVAVAAASSVRGIPAGELLATAAARVPDGEVAARLRRAVRPDGGVVGDGAGGAATSTPRARSSAGSWPGAPGSTACRPSGCARASRCRNGWPDRPQWRR